MDKARCWVQRWNAFSPTLLKIVSDELYENYTIKRTWFVQGTWISFSVQVMYRSNVERVHAIFTTNDTRIDADHRQSMDGLVSRSSHLSALARIQQFASLLTTHTSPHHQSRGHLPSLETQTHFCFPQTEIPAGCFHSETTHPPSPSKRKT
jgi:hypothetical protein